MLIRAVDTKDRRIGVWIPSPGLELAKNNSRALWEVLVNEPVTFANPIDVPCIGCGAVVVPPSCRLGNDSVVNLIEPELVQGCCNIRRKNAVVEEMTMDMVGKEHTVFGIVSQTLVEACGAAVIVSACNICTQGFHYVFGVPAMVSPSAIELFTVARGIPVLMRPVRIANVEVRDYVVDKIGDIQILLD
ncbi:hypothetical protein ES703_114814 [subsurface metagenome]